MLRVNIPASTGNIGVGFDSAGLSVSLYNSIDFCINNGALVIEQQFPNPNIPCDETNLVYVSAKKAADLMGKKLPSLYLRQHNRIPLASGLGSSAACIVGGVMIANSVLDARLSKAGILEIAAELEGHPDNAAPAIYGGICISQKTDKGFFTHPIPVKNDLALCFAVPSFALSTKEARKVLPKTLPVADAIHNIACMAFLISAIYSGQYSLLNQALDDRLHQPYRKQFIPRFDDIIKTALSLGAYGACLSGAGPTMLAFVNKESAQKFSAEFGATLKSFPGGWNVFAADLDRAGAYIENT